MSCLCVYLYTAFLPASVMLPPRRLKTLLSQAVQLQVERCPFHYVEQSTADYCLLTDHICSRYVYAILFGDTVVSRVSAHGRLNIIHDFGPHGCLPGIKIPYVCIEAATVAPCNAVHGCLPRSGRLPGTLW